MPIAMNPNWRCRFSLESDLDKPDGERLVFISRAITGSEGMRALEAFERAISLSDAEGIPLVLDTLKIGIVGWEHLRGLDGTDVPFGEFDKLPDVLTAAELWELAGCMVNRPRAQEMEERRKLIEGRAGATTTG